MKNTSLILLIILFYGCEFNNTKDVIPDIKTESKKETLIYFAPEFNYSTRVESIPKFIYDSLFQSKSITDKFDTDNLNLTDASINPNEYNKLLYFTLNSDSLWILSYKVGGFGVYNVVDILNKNNLTIEHRRIKTFNDIQDTFELKVLFDSLNFELYNQH